MDAGVRTIYDSAGFPLITICLPEDWTTEVTVNSNVQTGYGVPDYTLVTFISPDRRARISWQSPFHYRDDFLKPRKSGYDSYGNLHRPFMTAGQFIDFVASRDLKTCTDVSVVSEAPWSTNPRQMEYYRRQAERKAGNDAYTALGEIYCEGLQRQYSYVREQTARRRVYSLIVRSAEYAYWSPMPDTVTRALNDPFTAPMAKQMMERFANARYDDSLQEWIYTYSHYRDWRIESRLLLDCREEVFAKTVQEVFQPAVRHDVLLTEQMRERVNEKQKKCDDANRKKREAEEQAGREERARKEQQRAADEEQRRRHKQAQDQIRNTYREISEIRKSAWENRQKTQAKNREIWSDTIRGDTRFTDRYGDEHVIRTYNDHAYKNGDTYVTGDSPLDLGYDWEELKKKKY